MRRGVQSLEVQNLHLDGVDRTRVSLVSARSNTRLKQTPTRRINNSLPFRYAQQTSPRIAVRVSTCLRFTRLVVFFFARASSRGSRASSRRLFLLLRRESLRGSEPPFPPRLFRVRGAFRVFVSRTREPEKARTARARRSRAATRAVHATRPSPNRAALRGSANDRRRSKPRFGRAGATKRRVARRPPPPDPPRPGTAPARPGRGRRVSTSRRATRTATSAPRDARVATARRPTRE